MSTESYVDLLGFCATRRSLLGHHGVDRCKCRSAPGNPGAASAAYDNISACSIVETTAVPYVVVLCWRKVCSSVCSKQQWRERIYNIGFAAGDLRRASNPSSAPSDGCQCRPVGASLYWTRCRAACVHTRVHVCWVK